jgi:transposase-like protein
VIAYGVHESGRRELLGIDVGAGEMKASWADFLRSLVARGLTGVELVETDAHEGLKAAIRNVLGCPWQRCTVHFGIAAAVPRRAGLPRRARDVGRLAAVVPTHVGAKSYTASWASTEAPQPGDRSYPMKRGTTL